MKVAVLGAAGQLGGATVLEWRRAGHDVVPLTRADADLAVASHLRSALIRHKPDVILNCAAWNQVDASETNPLPALAVNADAVRSMVQVANALGSVFVSYSTDFVFDGTQGHPYLESDAPNPGSVYGMSKLLGEWFAAEADRSYVLRVESLFGGQAARSSIDRMFTTFLAGEPVTAFHDRWVSPSFVVDVTRATRALVEQEEKCGLYHCVNSGYATWLDVAQALRALLGRPEVPIFEKSAAEGSLVAPRPLFAALSNARLTSCGIPMPSWQNALARHVQSRTL